MMVVSNLRRLALAGLLLMVLAVVIGCGNAGVEPVELEGAVETVVVDELVGDEASAGEVFVGEEGVADTGADVVAVASGKVGEDVVTVLGVGQAEAANDAARFAVMIEVVAVSYREAADLLTALMQGSTALMEEAGVLPLDIETESAGVRKNYERQLDDDGNWRDELVGFSGYATLRAETDNLAVMTEVVSRIYLAYGDGTVSVRRFDFYVDDDFLIEREARGSAVEDMDVRAQQLAHFSGRSLGRLVSISEPAGMGGFVHGGFDDGLMRSAGALGMFSEEYRGGSDEYLPLSFGKSQRHVVVQGVYLLE